MQRKFSGQTIRRRTARPRDFIHVEDLGHAHILALEEADEGEQRIYSLGNGAGFTVAEVIQAARWITGRGP